MSRAGTFPARTAWFPNADRRWRPCRRQAIPRHPPLPLRSRQPWRRWTLPCSQISPRQLFSSGFCNCPLVTAKFLISKTFLAALSRPAVGSRRGRSCIAGAGDEAVDNALAAGLVEIDEELVAVDL